MTMQTWMLVQSVGLYLFSAIGLLVLASEVRSRAVRTGLCVIAAVWLATAVGYAVEISPDCEAMPWWLWWWAGCAFLP